jgi:hypothetical protein
METRLKVCEMEKIKRRCGFTSGLMVDCTEIGRKRSGGLALLWRENLNISISSYSVNHIFGSCEDVVTGQDWFFAGIYGHPEETNKKKTWHLIKDISAHAGGCCICSY